MKSERELVGRAKKNIRDFDVLYERYYPMINNFVYHRVANETYRNEIVSNVFFKAMKKINLFRFYDSRKCSFSSWLYRIAVNEINQFYRNIKRDQKIADMYRNEINHSVEKNDKKFELIKEKMSDFSPEEQNLISLKYFEKVKYKDLSEIFKRSEGAIKVQMHRILNKLRDNVKGDPRWNASKSS